LSIIADLHLVMCLGTGEMLPRAPPLRQTQHFSGVIVIIPRFGYCILDAIFI